METDCMETNYMEIAWRLHGDCMETDCTELDCMETAQSLIAWRLTARA